MCLAQGPQRSEAGEAQTHRPSVSSSWFNGVSLLYPQFSQQSLVRAVVECLTQDRWAAKFEPHRHHCVVSLSKNINPSLVLVQPRKSLVLVQPRKTHPYITERLLVGCKESNQTTKFSYIPWDFSVSDSNSDSSSLSSSSSIWLSYRNMRILNDLTLYLLLSSADNICEHFCTQISPNKTFAWFGSKLLDTLMVFLKEHFQKFDV